jgi:hypothetical protein
MAIASLDPHLMMAHRVCSLMPQSVRVSMALASRFQFRLESKNRTSTFARFYNARHSMCVKPLDSVLKVFAHQEVQSMMASRVVSVDSAQTAFASSK